MKHRIPALLIALLTFVCSSHAAPYEASFVAIVFEKGEGLYDPPDDEFFFHVFVAEEFWTKYVSPRLTKSTPVKSVRDGFHLAIVKREWIGKELAVEFRISLKEGSRPDFEAIRDGFIARLVSDAERDQQRALADLRSHLSTTADAILKESLRARIRQTESTRENLRILTTTEPNQAPHPTTL